MLQQLKFVICASTVLVSLSIFAQTPQRPTKMTFSYVEHPAIVNDIVPLIRDSYKKLGIETDFITQPSNRNLLLVEKNLLDGDVGYMRIVLDDYKDLITLEPPLVLGIFTLLCKPEVVCDVSVLADPKNTVVATSATKNGVVKGFKGELASQFYIVNDLSAIPKFISSGRFNYAIYPTTRQDIGQFTQKNVQYIELFDASLYHVLNKKYAFMADEISQAIQLTMQERAKKVPNKLKLNSSIHNNIQGY